MLASLGTREKPAIDDLEELAEQVGANHLTFQDFCRQSGPPGKSGHCAESALAPFFQAIESLRDGQRKEPVRVLHLGDSLIASDLITDMIRDRLQTRHGNGGRGFLFLDRPTRSSGRTVRTGIASPGWKIEKITEDRADLPPLGVPGVAFTANAPGELSRFQTDGAASAQLFFLGRPNGGGFTVAADGSQLQQISTRRDSLGPTSVTVPLPPRTKELSLQSGGGGPVTLFGPSFQAPAAGVIYDSIGLPGSTAQVLLKSEEASFKADLEGRAPSLVVVMLGGNEALELSRQRLAPEAAREHFESLLQRLQAGAPQAACLLIGPMDPGRVARDGP